MDQIKGTNLGNWLVLERWMDPGLFAGTGAEDEIWLGRKLPAAKLAEKLRAHRESYITGEDFALIARSGLNLVRIPVPYFVFGDCPPYPGCVEYLDRAFDWAERYDLRILLDLHTVPGSQNGYDNGGITGVCKWCKDPEAVEFALTVLERLARRYGSRKGLYGIEVLNEPISWLVYVTAPSTGKAEDKEEAKGSGHVPLPFLKRFYLDAYRRLRAILSREKVIVFHDGFRLGAWGDFFVRSGMEQVALDTHIYVFAMESFVPIHKPWVYRLYIDSQRRLIEKVQRHTPVIVGEWCICNRYAEQQPKPAMLLEQATEIRRQRYQEMAALQLDAWNRAAGHIYWNYQLLRSRTQAPDEAWKESWDLSRCLANGWMDFSGSGARR